MRPLALLVVLAGMVSAQGGPGQDDVLTLAATLEAAPTLDPDVLGAENALRAAERTLTRLQADPLALRVPTLQAQGGVESARAGLSAARLVSRTEATGAYFAALGAGSALELTEAALDLETAKLEATRIRFEAGAATRLELLQAENSLDAAKRDLTDAEQTRSLALRELGSLVGQDASRLGPVSLTVPAVPTLVQSLTEATRTNSGVRAVASALEVAEAELAAVDNAFSAQADIEAVRDNLASVESALQTARRSLELSVRGAHGELESAARSFENAQASFAAAGEELAAQQARLDAGSLAPIAFEESRLMYRRSEAELYGALYEFRLAALALEGTISGGGAESGFEGDVTTPAVDDSNLTEPSSETGELGESESTSDTAPVEPDTVAPVVPTDPADELDTP